MKKSNQRTKTGPAAPAETTMVPSAAKDGPSPEAYGAVVKQADLSNLQLIASSFALNPMYFSTPAEQRELAFDFEIDQDIHSPKDGVGSAVFRWWVEARVGETVLLRAEASFLIIYQGLSDVNSHAVKMFIRRVGRFATYPYFRSHVAQLSWESRADLPPMPVLRE